MTLTENESLRRKLAKKNKILGMIKNALDRVVYEKTGKQQILFSIVWGEPDYETIKNWLEGSE